MPFDAQAVLAVAIEADTNDFTKGMEQTRKQLDSTTKSVAETVEEIYALREAVAAAELGKSWTEKASDFYAAMEKTRTQLELTLRTMADVHFHAMNMYEDAAKLGKSWADSTESADKFFSDLDDNLINTQKTLQGFAKDTRGIAKALKGVGWDDTAAGFENIAGAVGNVAIGLSSFIGYVRLAQEAWGLFNATAEKWLEYQRKIRPMAGDNPDDPEAQGFIMENRPWGQSALVPRDPTNPAHMTSMESEAHEKKLAEMADKELLAANAQVNELQQMNAKLDNLSMGDGR